MIKCVPNMHLCFHVHKIIYRANKLLCKQVCQIPETWHSPDGNIGAVGVKVSHRGFEKKKFVLCESIALES